MINRPGSVIAAVIPPNLGLRMKKSNPAWIALTLFSICCLARAQEVDTSSDRDVAGRLHLIEQYIDDHMELVGCPGLSVAAFENGSLVFTESYGVANAKEMPVTKETIFSVASITKPLVAMAILKLEDENLIQLDNRVAVHIPGFADAVPVLAEKLTVRHLLTHYSGIATESGRLGWRELDALINDREELFDKVARAKITSGVGEVHQYSNVNYWLLGRIINEVTGENYATYIDRELFSKLELRNTKMNKPSGDAVAQPHLFWFGSPVPQAVEPFNSGPSGGLYTTAPDYARFLMEFQNENPLVFPPGIVKRMAMRPPGDNKDNPKYWQGLGWQVFQDDSGNCFWHSGLNIGYEGLVFVDPNKDSGIVIFSNAGSGFADNDVSGFLRGIAWIWNGEEPVPLNDFRAKMMLFWGAICLAALILIWAVWFVVRFVRGGLGQTTKSSGWVGIIAPSVSLVVLGLAVYFVVPDMFEANMRVARAYNPDAAFVMTCLATVSCGFGILRFLTLVLLRRRSIRYAGIDAG